MSLEIYWLSSLTGMVAVNQHPAEYICKIETNYNSLRKNGKPPSSSSDLFGFYQGDLKPNQQRLEDHLQLPRYEVSLMLVQTNQQFVQNMRLSLNSPPRHDFLMLNKGSN